MVRVLIMTDNHPDCRSLFLLYIHLLSIDTIMNIKMKQIIIVFIAFIVSSIGAFSQGIGVPQMGYRGFVDLNSEALFEKKYSNDRDIVYSISGFTTTHGYQFNEHFFCGRWCRYRIYYLQFRQGFICC